MFYSKTSLRALALVTPSLVFCLATAGCDAGASGNVGVGGPTGDGGQLRMLG